MSYRPIWRVHKGLEYLDYSTPNISEKLRKYEKAKGFKFYSCTIEPGGRILHDTGSDIVVISSIHRKEFKVAIGSV